MLLLLTAALMAGVQSGNDLYQQGLAREASGDIKGAIQIFERIVQDFSSNRTLTARALLQLGRWSELLGQEEARKYYERVIREFANEPDQANVVAQANARLKALASTPPPADCTQPFPDPITIVDASAGPGSSSNPTLSRDGCWLFVMAGPAARGPGVHVLRRTRQTYAHVRTIATPFSSPVSGMTQTHDRQLLIVGAANWLTFIDIERATSGHADPVVGRASGFQGAFKISVSPDDKYLFVPQFVPGRVAVFDLERARKSGFSTDAVVPSLVPTGQRPITTLASPDGRYVYSTNLVAPDVVGGPLTCLNATQREGGIQVIDVQRAVTDAATATIGWAYPAGCGVNAMTMSPDGTRLSNTAADDIYNTGATLNFLTVFDATPVREGKPPRRLGSVPISKGPISVVDTGTRIIVGFQQQGDSFPDLMVIDPTKVAAGRDAIIGTIPYPAGGLGLSADKRTLMAGSSKGIAFIDLERVTLRAPAP
jgi:hypothetical protein